MTRFLLIGCLTTAACAGLSSVASAQPKDDDYFEAPTTPADFWRAMKFEMAVGKFDLAGDFLKGFLATNPTDKDLLDIERKEGMIAFLRLRNVPKWSNDPKIDKEVKQNVERVITAANAALKKLLTDPERIAKYVTNLTKTAEERAFALKELYRSGSAVMPVLIGMLKEMNDPRERSAILSALPELGLETVPPLLAALDTNDASLREQLLQVLRQRGDLVLLMGRTDTDPLPMYWHLSASPTQDPRVRKEATDQLVAFLSKDLTTLPSAKTELTIEAEKLFRHQGHWTDPNAVTIWKWTGTTVASSTLTVSQAEEHFGLRYARWALEIDPTYTPAQEVFLALALAKAMERGGLEQPLAKTAPGVHDLLASAHTELLTSLLERAMREKQTTLVLALVRTLGERAEVRTARPSAKRPGLLVQALNYPDRRVQFAAAEALVLLPGPPQHQSSAVIVEVLRRAVAAEDAAKAAGATKPLLLIGDADRDRAEALGRLAESVGYRSVIATTGREIVKRLNEAADVDVVMIDHQLAYPQLPSLLAQLRQDRYNGLLPLRVVLASPAAGRIEDRELRLQKQLRPYANVKVVREPLTTQALSSALADGNAAAGPPLSDAERKLYQSKALDLLRRMANGSRPGYDARPAEAAIRGALTNNDLAPTAIEATSHFGTRDAQTALANVILAEDRPLPIRLTATDAFVQHVQANGPLLDAVVIMRLRELAEGEKSAELKGKLASLRGSLRPDPRATGERLRTYTPPQPGGAAPPPMEKE